MKLAEDSPCRGTLTIKFKGTLLVSRPTKDTTVTLSGKVRKELERPEAGKAVYYGDGSVVIKGAVDAVQFFGSNIDGHFVGNAVFRFYGEFDKNLDTGEFWYPGQPHIPWGTGGYTVVVPQDMMGAPKPEIKVVPKGEATKSAPGPAGTKVLPPMKKKG